MAKKFSTILDMLGNAITNAGSITASGLITANAGLAATTVTASGAVSALTISAGGFASGQWGSYSVSDHNDTTLFPFTAGVTTSYRTGFGPSNKPSGSGNYQYGRIISSTSLGGTNGIAYTQIAYDWVDSSLQWRRRVRKPSAVADSVFGDWEKIVDTSALIGASYIPYTGADKAVNLGAQTLTASGLITANAGLAATTITATGNVVVPNSTTSTHALNVGTADSRFANIVHTHVAANITDGNTTWGTLASANTWMAAQIIERTGVTANALLTRETSDIAGRYRFIMRIDGTHEWGIGGVSRDTFLWRSATNTLSIGSTDSNASGNLNMGALTASTGLFSGVVRINQSADTFENGFRTFNTALNASGNMYMSGVDLTLARGNVDGIKISTTAVTNLLPTALNSTLLVSGTARIDQQQGYQWGSNSWSVAANSYYINSDYSTWYLDSAKVPAGWQFRTHTSGTNFTSAMILSHTGNATFTGTVACASATADSHAINRIFGDGRYARAIAPVADLNTLDTTKGLFLETDGTHANNPLGESNWTIWNFGAASANRGVQLAGKNSGSSAYFVRAQNLSTTDWKSWQRIVTEPYGDTVYGRLDSTNTWTSSNIFNGITATSVKSTGLLWVDGNDLLVEGGVLFKNKTDSGVPTFAYNTTTGGVTANGTLFGGATQVGSQAMGNSDANLGAYVTFVYSNAEFSAQRKLQLPAATTGRQVQVYHTQAAGSSLRILPASGETISTVSQWVLFSGSAPDTPKGALLVGIAGVGWVVVAAFTTSA